MKVGIRELNATYINKASGNESLSIITAAGYFAWVRILWLAKEKESTLLKEGSDHFRGKKLLQVKEGVSATPEAWKI